VKGSNVLATSYWDEPAVRRRFGPPPGPRIRVLIEAGERQELYGPSIDE